MNDQLYDLTLTGFVYGGDALGRIPDDAGRERVVFVPFALPGERVRIRLVEQRRGFARGELVQVVDPSPFRIQARCKHFGVCGGCHYQHIPYELQLKAKADIVRDQFRRIGHIDDAPVHETIPSQNPWNYRNQVQFHLTPEGRLGYIKAGLGDDLAAEKPGQRGTPARPGAILPISECHLPESAVNNVWPDLDFEAGIDLDRVAVRQGVDEELMVVLESDDPALPELEVESGVSVVHTIEEHSIVMAGADHIAMCVSGRDFRVSASSFFQVNTGMAAQMVEHVLAGVTSLLGPQESNHLQVDVQQTTQPGSPALSLAEAVILDVYCGVGLFSAFLAPLCKRLIGIESSSSACEDFSVNLDEFDNVELYEDFAENVLPTLNVQPDIMLVDPPRAGLDVAARDGILRLQPQIIIYVSCDPSTLARDARRIIDGGYRLTSVIPFDLFPQTYHIESISWFERQQLP
jgi:23S rRNA (uracil1939-C5)-methyltransferase